MPIFRVKSVKIYIGQKNLHGYIRGFRDKYEVCFCRIFVYQKIRRKPLNFDENFYLECSPQLMVDHLVVPIGEHVSREPAAY